MITWLAFCAAGYVVLGIVWLLGWLMVKFF
jgi:hypothetical protein